MTGMMNLMKNEPEQLELYDDDYVHDVYLIESDATEEEEPIPTWGEIVKDPESMFILFSLISVVALMIFW